MGIIFLMFPVMWTSLDKNKTPSEADLKKIQSFVYCKWLAGDYRTIATANTINQYSDIPIENQYYLVKNQFAGKIRNITVFSTPTISKSISLVDVIASKSVVANSVSLLDNTSRTEAIVSCGSP